MDAAVRFSQKSLPGHDGQYYLKVDIAGRALQIYNIKGKRKGVLKQELVYTSQKLSPFRAFDWHPSQDTLIAVGHTGGEASLVNLSGDHSSNISFPVRSQRSCNAVGLNTENWIAIGLDKVRTDVCLSTYDVTQRSPNANQKGHGRGLEPLHKLAPGEPITSLRFFHDQPKLLAAGIKGQFIRIYDLRENHSSPALQFHTRCVNNIALNTQDENYIASCLPANVPTVTIWDRRMVSRTSVANVGFGGSNPQSNQHPEASAELKAIVDPAGTIWGLRFSKTHRNQLGVLSSTGQLRIVDIAALPGSKDVERPHGPDVHDWEHQDPQDVFLDSAYNFTNAWTERPKGQELQRLVSFDFTTGCSRNGQPKIVTLTGAGHVNLLPLPAQNVRVASSSIRNFESAALRNDQSTASGERVTATDAKKLNFMQSNVATIKQRVQAGYLFDTSTNIATISGDSGLSALWTWIQHAQSIALDNQLVSEGVDLSYLGVYSLWMESLDARCRSLDKAYYTTSEIGALLRTLAKKLHLDLQSRASEYSHNRALCLFVLGLPWTNAAIEKETQVLVAQNEHSKAAALALMSGEFRLAQKALRSAGSQNTHKMLAMALIGGRNRKESRTHDKSQDEEWLEIVDAVSGELADPYSRAILSYVKSGNWNSVIAARDIPLQYRLTAALRHFDDSKLTKHLSELKSAVIASGDLEGIAFTGLGTPESVALLQAYVRRTNDIQSAALALSFGAASDRFLNPVSSEIRLVHSFREAYKRHLLHGNMSIPKTMFTVKLAEMLRKYDVINYPRPKETVRLVCKHCNGSTAIFGHEQHISSTSVTWEETAKNILMPEKAAIVGTICPKCGRQLQQCGVCDLPLGTGDETYAKWYKPKVDLSASVAGTTVTAIGPGSNTPSARDPKFPTSEIEEAIEVVEETTIQRENLKKRDELLRMYITVCMLCSHAFHADHARQWFEGNGNMNGHKVCPVPHCNCACRTGMAR